MQTQMLSYLKEGKKTAVQFIIPLLVWSYFDPQFFTKNSLDERITVVDSFTLDIGGYGLESGAHGVVEGSSTERLQQPKH